MLTINPDSPSDYGQLNFDDFYPIIDLNDFNKTMRVGNATITKPRMEFALKNAYIQIENEILDRRAAWANEGHTKLINIPSPSMGQNETILTHSWKSALYGLANIQLLNFNSDISATHESYSIDGQIRPQTDDLHVMVNQSLKTLNGNPNILAELV